MITADLLAKKLQEYKLFCPLGLVTDEKGVAAVLGMSPRTVRGWRAEGKGPPVCNASVRRTLYQLEELAAWMNGDDEENSLADCGNSRQITAGRGK
jgi:hypothetical protein